MPFVTRKSVFTLALLAVAGGLAAGLFVWSGIYNIGADDSHTKPVHALLQMLREQSINHHARDLKVPDLSDPALIRRGAGNYDAMCTGCHLAPGNTETELSRGLYPSPPDFTKAKVTDAAHHFWVIKHGIKASGMPAWGKSMDDEYIWGMVAFLQQLPRLDKTQYRAMVASSGGHSHGGGESEHHHADQAPDHHEDSEAGQGHGEGEAEPHHAGMPATTAEGMTHVHADGSRHVHPASKDGTAQAGMPMPATTDEHLEHDHHH